MNPLPRTSFPPKAEVGSGQVTIVRDVNGSWTQIVGPAADPGGNPFTTFIAESEHPDEEELRLEHENEFVDSIAPEAGSEDSWLALDSDENAASGPLAQAIVQRVSATGALEARQTLPSPQETSEGVGPKGAAEKLVCPERNDCWLATSQGWLFHLSQEGARRNEDPSRRQRSGPERPDHRTPARCGRAAGPARRPPGR